MSKYKNLDDFVLFHYTYGGYKGIMETKELRSSWYLSGYETDWGISGGGNPKKIYTTLYKKDKVKDLIKNWQGFNIFIFDPRMILPYRDKVNFPVGEGFGADGNPYKRFPKTPLKGFEDLWPKNDEEELALNLNHYWEMSVEEYNNHEDIYYYNGEDYELIEKRTIDKRAFDRDRFYSHRRIYP